MSGTNDRNQRTPAATAAPAMQPTASYFAVAGAALALALTLLDPDSSAGLGFAPRLFYWLTHVGAALVLLVSLQKLLRPRKPQLAPGAVWRVGLVGLLGAAAFLPFAGLLEGLFFGEPASGFAEEAAEVLPQVLVFWALLNLPFLLQLGRPDASSSDAPIASTLVEAPAPSNESERQPHEPETTQPAESPPSEEAGTQHSTPALLDSLPTQLGDRLVAISTELHYLRIYTDRGNALVLGSLGKLESSGELPTGLRIHRSHWVATQAVRRLAKRDGTLVCVLDNELELPVSRRRARAAREAFEGVEVGSLERPERPRPR